MCSRHLAKRIKLFSHIVYNVRFFVVDSHQQNDYIAIMMKPIEHITIGSLIRMVKSGKEYVVDKITPKGIALRECARIVTFSKSALNERLTRGSAEIIEH